QAAREVDGPVERRRPLRLPRVPASLEHDRGGQAREADRDAEQGPEDGAQSQDHGAELEHRDHDQVEEQVPAIAMLGRVVAPLPGEQAGPDHATAPFGATRILPRRPPCAAWVTAAPISSIGYICSTGAVSRPAR